MTKLKCKMAGKTIEGKHGMLALCKDCNGVIIIESNSVSLSTKTEKLLSPPKKPSFEFNCPATLENPKNSELVK